MGVERTPIITHPDLLGSYNRRLRQQERRPSVTTAAEILGPGFGPTATQVLDWSSEDAVFGGFFWSDVGALNSPDTAKRWIGIVLAEDDRLAGVQRIWTHRDSDPPREYVRRWSYDLVGNLTFTAWRGDSAFLNAGVVTGLAGSTINTQQGRISRNIASISFSITIGVDIAVGSDGNVADTALAQVTPGFVPQGASYVQMLSGTSGSHWFINNDGRVALANVNPNMVLTAGVSAFAVGGTYLL